MDNWSVKIVKMLCPMDSWLYSWKLFYVSDEEELLGGHFKWFFFQIYFENNWLAFGNLARFILCVISANKEKKKMIIK